MDAGRQSNEQGGHFGRLKVMENYRSCGGAAPARLCPAQRLRPGAIQAFSSRAGLQDDARWHPTTPSNYLPLFFSPLQAEIFLSDLET